MMPIVETQKVTVCDADTEICEVVELPPDFNIYTDTPENSVVAVVPFTENDGSVIPKEVVIVDNTPEDPYMSSSSLESYMQPII